MSTTGIQQFLEGLVFPSSLNSSATALSASGEFPGPWEVNEAPHALVNVKPDVDGTLYIELGIVTDRSQVRADGTVDDAYVVQTFQSERTVYAAPDPEDPGYFRTLVKGSRAFRIRYVNGAEDQASFALHTDYGFGFLPSSGSDDNELLITETERERDVSVALQLTDIAASGFAGFIDLSDTTNFPHDRSGRIDLTSTNFLIDRDTNATGAVRIGVITRIDGTDADIAYVRGVAFDKQAGAQVERDRRESPSQIKCGVEGGALKYFMTGFKETSVTAINTGMTLTRPDGSGTFTPAVGDIVVRYLRTAGTYSAAVSVTYHGEASV